MHKLAILLHGTNEEKLKIENIKSELQKQLNQTKPGEVDVVYYIDDEMSIEQKQDWLKKETDAKKYVFVTAECFVPNNYIVYRLNAIKNGKKAEELIELGIHSK